MSKEEYRPQPSNPPEQPNLDIDELLNKLQHKEEKRSRRPIKLYRTAYDEERYRLLHNKTLAHTHAAKKAREEQEAQMEELERLRDNEFPSDATISYDDFKRRYDEWDHQFKEKHINALKTRQGISRRINFALSIFKVEYLNELREQDPEALDPILRGVAMRTATGKS